MHIKVQISLSLVLYRPVSNLFKILARMRCSHVPNHFLLLLTPLPVYRADIRGTLERLPQLLVAMLHVKDIVFSFFRTRCQVHLVDVRVYQLAQHIEAM